MSPNRLEKALEIYFGLATALFYGGAIILVGGFFTLWTIPILPVVIATATGGIMVIAAFIFMMWAVNH